MGVSCSLDNSVKVTNFIKVELNYLNLDVRIANIAVKNSDLRDYFVTCVKAVRSMKDGRVVEYSVELNKMLESLHRKKAVYDFLAEIKFVETSVQVYRDLIELVGSDHYQESVDSSKYYAQKALILLRQVWGKFSERSESFASALMSEDIAEEMKKDLKSLDDADADSLEASWTFESALIILQNCSYFCKNRKELRELKMVKILQKFLNCGNSTKVNMHVLPTLTLLMTDDESEQLIASHETSLNVLLEMTKNVCKPDVQKNEEFSFDQLMLCMKGLSNNEKMKKPLVDLGILDFVAHALVDGSDDQKEDSASLVFNLSIGDDNKNAILGNETIVKSLEAIAKSSDDQTSKDHDSFPSAELALWVLNVDEHVKNVTTASGTNVFDRHHQKAKSHVMISYNWDNQKEILKIKKSLDQAGFDVWLDKEKVHGSTLASMAKAVEDSSVVLVCMSRKYKESKNCLCEAQYAYKLGRPVIPLLMERDYEPDGWLGIMVNVKLYYDFSGKFVFEEKVQELVSGIKAAGGLIKSENKLKRAKLQQLQGQLNPSQIAFLRQMLTEAPDFYYRLLNNLVHGDVSLEQMIFMLNTHNLVAKDSMEAHSSTSENGKESGSKDWKESFNKESSIESDKKDSCKESGNKDNSIESGNKDNSKESGNKDSIESGNNDSGKESGKQNTSKESGSNESGKSADENEKKPKSIKKRPYSSQDVDSLPSDGDGDTGHTTQIPSTKAKNKNKQPSQTIVYRVQQY